LLIDLLGNEIFSGFFYNQKEIRIPLELSNHNLLICKVVTKNEIKVIKLIKGI
jgi:hypothetical protein